MPGDHDFKKKKKELKEKLAKINDDNTRGDVDVDKNEQYKSVATNEYYNKHDADMGGYNKDILDKVQLKNQKKVKKADLSDVTKEQKKKKGKERLVHKASKGVDTYSSQDPKNSKVKKKHVKGKVSKQLTALRKKVNKIKNNPSGQIPITHTRRPPQGPSGGTADTPESIIKDAEAVAKPTSYIAKDHDHTITFKGYKGAQYKRASLISNTGKYAKYWLLNAKQTNGNGWGVSQQSIAKNIHKFVGKPLVVTAKSWIPDSEYGDAYEHPYLPTNDINKVFDHQEKFRVGSIVDIIEKDGDYFANIELNQKFAHMVMPPFCSPAIFQNNPSEPEGQISDWEALHLAALHEDPAYGSRIALLRGTCVGTKDQCTVQFKAAKQEAKMVCTKGLKGRLATLKKNDLKSKLATFRNKGAKPPEENTGIFNIGGEITDAQDIATRGINDKKYNNIDLKVRDYGEKARTEHREIGPIEGVFAENEPPHPFPKDVEELVTKDVGEPEMLFGPESPTGEDMIRHDKRMVPATFEYIKEKYEDSLDYIIDEDGNPVKYEIGDDGDRYMGDRSKPDSVANEGDYFSLKNEEPRGIGAGAPVETRAKRQESLQEARQLVRSYIPGVKDMSNKKIDELLGYISRNNISSFNDIQVMDISNENAQRWSKLKQRIAGIQRTAPKIKSRFGKAKRIKLHKDSYGLEQAMIKGIQEEYGDFTDMGTLSGSHFLTTDGVVVGSGGDDHRSLVEQAIQRHSDRKLRKMLKDPKMDRTDLMHEFMKQSGLVRINGSSRTNYGKGDMSFSTFHPLSSGQRRFLNSHIENSGMSTDNIAFDDMSDDQSVGRQLGLRGEYDDENTQYAKLKQRIAAVSPTKINQKDGETIANAYDKMLHNPNDSAVKESYNALIGETNSQFNELKKNGLRIDPIKEGTNPYQSADDLHNDLKKNNHIYYYPSEKGFGSGDNKFGDHPLLSESPSTYKGKKLLNNDVFRIVHDVNGHNLANSDFSPEGEHNAFLQHRKMYSPLAGKALFTETAAQSNWGSWNKKSGASNRKLIDAGRVNELEFADQKAGLLSDDIINTEWHTGETRTGKLKQRLSRVDISESDKFHKRLNRERDYVSDLINNKKSKAYDKHGNIKALPDKEIEALDKYVDKGTKIRPPKPTQKDRKRIISAKQRLGRLIKGKQRNAVMSKKVAQIINSFKQSGFDPTGTSGVWDAQNSKNLNAYEKPDLERIWDIYGRRGMGFNSVTNTIKGPNNDIGLIAKQLTEIEEQGGIPALGFDNGSLEAVNVTYGTKDEVLNKLLPHQNSTGYIDEDGKLDVPPNPRYQDYLKGIDKKQ